MACIEKIYSVSAVIGDGKCNANCSFCSGKTLGRGKRDIVLHKTNMRNLEFAIKLSYFSNKFLSMETPNRVKSLMKALTSL